MNKTILITVGLLISLILAGAVFLLSRKIERPMETMKKEGKKIIISKEDINKEITVGVGDVIQIELEAAGATGYWWYIDNLDKEYLNLASEETKQQNADSNLAGAPVMGIWVFKALKAGETEIKMDYYRNWEEKESASDHFLIKLKIE